MKLYNHKKTFFREHIDVTGDVVDVVISRILRLDPIYAKPAVFIEGDSDGVGFPSFEAFN